MDSKRPANGQHEDAPDQKKAKTDGKPALNLEALKKAKLLLEKQKALREKLKKVPALAGTAAAAGAAAAAAGQPSAAMLAAATANPLAPGLSGVNAAEVVAKAAKAVEIASKFGVQASLAGVPALAAATAPGILAAHTAALPGGLPGMRPVLAPPIAATAAAAAAGVPGVQPVMAGGPGGGPRPLRLDASGREIDDAGNVIQAVRVPVATSLINMPRPEPVREPSPPPGPKDEDFIDTTMAVRSGPGRTRARGGAFLAPGRGRGKKGALEFVEEGSLQRQAEIMRLKQKYGEAEFRKHLPAHLRRPPRGPAGPSERPDMDGYQPPMPPPSFGADGDMSSANLVPLGVRQVEESEEDKLRKKLPEVAAEPPEVEWWDKPLLDGGAYYTSPAPADQQDQQEQQQQGSQGEGGQEDEQQQKGKEVIGTAGGGLEMRLRVGKLTRYVEHPIPLEPPDEGPPPAPQPLKLTKRELKKLRTQRRQAREKEKQELMRQGLLEPPKPKVKISNLMRVLGEEAVLDPTAIEQEVRRQMSERQTAHEDRNLARMLTPAERRDKKLKKLFEGDGMGSSSGAATTNSTLCAVYRVESLAHGQHRFKVDVNAKENHMSGIMLVCPSAFSLVVVEGVPKALKRYHKLMLRRINWAEAPAAAGDGAGEDEEEEGGAADKQANSCHLVWEGVVPSNAFKDFVKEEVETQEAGRKLLEDKGVAHYWDAAANFDFDAAPLPSAVFDR